MLDDNHLDLNLFESLKLKLIVLDMNLIRAQIEVFHFDDPENLGPNLTGNLTWRNPLFCAITIVYRSKLKSSGPDRTSGSKDWLNRVG